MPRIAIATDGNAPSLVDRIVILAAAVRTKLPVEVWWPK